MAAALSEGEPAGTGKKVAEGEAEAAAKQGGTAAPLEGDDTDDSAVGLPHWKHQRASWVSGCSSSKQVPGAGGAAAGAKAPVIDPDANYDDLLLTNEPFEVPIPLPEMVDFLVDTWIDDGLY